MKKINFKKFKMFTDITGKGSAEIDISLDFADKIYKNTNGVVAHDLALRIYRSEGEIELSADELEVLSAFVSKTTPIFQDSFNANLI